MQSPQDVRRIYIHQLQDWPRFHWNRDRLTDLLASVRHRQGRLIGHMEALGFNLQQEAVLLTLTADVLKTSDIEGEKLNAGQVRSSMPATWASTSEPSSQRTEMWKAWLK